MKCYNKLLPFGIYIFTACTNNAPTTTLTAIDTTETDTINYALNEDSVKLQMANTTPPEGFYGVTLPCTNCKGIEHTVLFNPDLSYRLEEKILESNNASTKTTGSWKPVNGDIWLYKDSSVVARYSWKGDTLHYIDFKSGVRIPLRRLESILTNETWINRRTEGIDVFAVGTEPFWSISIDEQKSMVFTMSDRPKPVTFKTPKPIVSADSAVYQTGKDTAALRVVIYDRFGSDGMSGNLYPNTVTVYYKKQVLQGSGMRY